MNEIETINQEILSLDDIYFKDAFTKTEDKLNLEVDNANVKCLTSKDNKFSLDNDGNLIVKSLTAETINVQNFFDAMYPIGSIYITIGDTNPSTLFGGVWEQIKDTFLLGVGDKYEAGTTGGEAEHKLIIEEMPSHDHKIQRSDGGTSNVQGWGSNQWDTGYISTSGTNPKAPTMIITKTGGSKAHNNMPPYLTVYMWKRIS